MQVFNLILVDAVPNSSVLQKVNMSYLSKATQKDKSLKTGLIKTTNHQPTNHRPTNQSTHRPTNLFPLTRRPTKHLPTAPINQSSSTYVKTEDQILNMFCNL